MAKKKKSNKKIKKVLFTATVDSHILHFHIPYLKMFKENGYEVHVATNGDETIPYCDKKHKISFERSPFKINNLKAIKQLKKVIDEEKFEIIHCHTPMGSVVTRLAAKKARKNGTRVIYTAHGFHFYKGAPILNWLLFYPIEKWLSRYTDTLITINQEDYDLAKRKFHSRQIELVHGVGVDPEKFNFEMSEEEKDKLREEIGIEKDDFVMIYPAELSKRKNQGMILRCVAELVKENKKIKLLLPGLDSMNGLYQQMAKDLNVEDNVKFLGYRTDIPKLLKISNLAVSTARQEGLPVNIMEAMVCGLPAVVTNCRGNRDLVEDGVNGYIVEIDDDKEMIQAICRIKNIENSKIIKTVYKYVLSDVIENMTKIYSEIKKTILIIPTCTDLNRGDQALVFETAEVARQVYGQCDVYMMADKEEVQQCKREGIKIFTDILKHPSRYRNKHTNINYSLAVKISWGIIAIFDFLISSLLLNKITRSIVKNFLSANVKESIKLFEKCDAFFVKGGGFLHDYSGGMVGVYTTYYQTFHIKLALNMNKKVYIMPNSFGPFKSKLSKNMVRRVLKECQFVSARESISCAASLNGLDMDIEKYPDLAFFLDVNKKFDANLYLKEYGINVNDKCVAVTVRPYRFAGYTDANEKYKQYKESIKQFILWLNDEGYLPLLVVHTRAINDHENDEKCINEICDLIGNDSKYKIIKDDNLSCRELKAIYGQCEFIVGTRFHSVIFSISQGVPAVSITYGGNKGDGITKDIDKNKYSIKIDDVTFEKLKNKFNELRENKYEAIKNIQQYIDKCKEQYQEMINKIKIISQDI